MTSEKMMEMIMMVYDRLDVEEKKNADYYLKNLAIRKKHENTNRTEL